MHIQHFIRNRGTLNQIIYMLDLALNIGENDLNAQLMVDVWFMGCHFMLML